MTRRRKKDFESMLVRQQYKCLGCKRSISERNVFTMPIKVRGLLCDSCNTVLGQVQESKSTLRRLMAYLSYDRTKTHIYLVGSLRNPKIPHLAQTLRKEGYEVFSEWHNPGPEADMHWQEHEKLKGSSYKEALEGSHVENVFYYDKTYIDFSDIVIMVMPAGRSGHLELGYAAGCGKKTFILLDKEPEQYDVMPRFSDAICNNVSELIDELRKT
jgi:nucleoside 2-deoxyribosyltransferase